MCDSSKLFSLEKLQPIRIIIIVVREIIKSCTGERLQGFINVININSNTQISTTFTERERASEKK